MSRLGILARGVGISALIAVTATPALAFPGKADRARTAIAEAQAKVDAANKTGANGETPAQLAQAQAALATAKENLSRGNKEEAFDDATHAGMLADTAMGVTQKRQNEAAAAQQANADASAAQAQQAVNDANQRAADAQQQAAVASAQADAMRNAPPPPPPPATTVTVEKEVHPVSAVKRTTTTTRRVVHHTTATAAPAVAEKTTVSTSTSND